MRRDNIIWRMKGGMTLSLGAKSRIMGIINVTPDSFSDGGKCAGLDRALTAAKRMIAEGADILDIGGESTRPNAAPVSPEEEQRRIIPAIKALASHFPQMPLSVDTYRAETALKGLEAGAHCVNDIFGLQKDPDMAPLIAETGAGLVLMHTGREREKLADVFDDERLFFTRSLNIAAEAGIKRERIILDPGFGFAKTEAENIALLSSAERLREFGLPLLAGTSRKRFLGHLSGRDIPSERDAATAATSVILRQKGFALFRVHNVALNREALNVADAVTEAEAK